MKLTEHATIQASLHHNIKTTVMRAMKTLLSGKLIIALTFIAILSASCEKENIINSEKPDRFSTDYFPLMTGNIWNYSRSRVLVKHIVSINKKEYYEVVSESIVADTVFYTYTEYYRKTSDGKIYTMDSDKKREALKYDFNVPVNGSWTYAEDDNNHIWKVTKISNTLKVNVTNRQIANCMKFDYDLIQAVDDEHTIILAPGIGRLVSQSYAWGMGDTLKNAIINGIEYKIR
jgi:hypothetical protein